MPGPVLEWREAARDDLLAIVDTISDDNPTAAQALKDEIEAKVSRLPDHPRLYRSGRVAGTRDIAELRLPSDRRCKCDARRANPERITHIMGSY